MAKAEWKTVRVDKRSTETSADNDHLQRLRVPGGWIYKTTDWSLMKGSDQTPRFESINVSICFVPRPEGKRRKRK